MHAIRGSSRLVRLLLAVVMLAMGVALGLGAMAVAQSNTVYHACVNNSSGTIKMVTASGTCASNEMRIVWNQQGPPGVAGPQGARRPRRDGSTRPTRPTRAAGAAG